MSLSRRQFIGAGSSIALGLGMSEIARGQLPNAVAGGSPPVNPRAVVPANGPIAVGSTNGIRGMARAREMMLAGTDPLDAAVAGVNIQELDPEDDSVGLGGLPNEHGVVQLDASLMHGPSRRAGAVGALEDIATASLVAKAVMDYTDHILLVGAGAKRFALEMGFREQNLLTEGSRQNWLRWKACLSSKDSWLDHTDPVVIKFTDGTVHISALNAAGNFGSVTTTSGLSWKVPGRVGDTAVVGAGQYCDNDVGSAGSTGRGEANIKTCGAFLIVETMRQGVSPEEACLRVLRRAIAMTEPRLLDVRGRPRYDLTYYALAKDGRFGAAALYSGKHFAVADAAGARKLDCAYLFPVSERPPTPKDACGR